MSARAQARSAAARAQGHGFHPPSAQERELTCIRLGQEAEADVQVNNIEDRLPEPRFPSHVGGVWDGLCKGHAIPNVRRRGAARRCEVGEAEVGRTSDLGGGMDERRLLRVEKEWLVCVERIELPPKVAHAIRVVCAVLHARRQVLERGPVKPPPLRRGRRLRRREEGRRDAQAILVDQAPRREQPAPALAPTQQARLEVGARGGCHRCRPAGLNLPLWG